MEFYKFIYVFDKTEAYVLEKEGFNLISSDDNNGIYVFENRPNAHIKFSNGGYVYSNTLSFSHQ